MNVSGEYSPETLMQWLERNTTIQGMKFSFKDHEYQARILQSKKRLQYTKKCSQLGITELKVRRLLATCYMIPHFNAMLTFPTESMANEQAKSRVDPVIDGSPALLQSRVTSKDSSSLKGIGSSQLFIRGTYSKNAAISVPVDLLGIDELDFSDPEVIGSLDSRQTHSKYKWRMETSTPTLPNFGIDRRMQSSNRFFNFCKCHHCNHQFIPSYTEHVVVPGYTDDILLLGEGRLHKTRWTEAYLMCPRCGKVPDLSPQYREWVCENPDEQHPADGFQLSPFDAPAYITVQDLLQGRLQYWRIADFVNFRLGHCYTDEQSGIQEEDLDLMLARSTGRLGAKVLGVDMGTDCHWVLAQSDGVNRIDIEKIGSIHFKDLDRDLTALIQRESPRAIVMDGVPYTPEVFRFQQRFRNLYASLYVNASGMRPYRLLDEEEDKSEALFDERQINVNRDVALDMLMEDIRAGQVGLNPSIPEDELALYRKHLQDMRRVRKDVPKNQPDREGFRWAKSREGQAPDHYHHATLYAWIAARIKTAARSGIVLSPSSMVMGVRAKFKDPELA